MATDKRERQRANRAQKQAEAEAQAKRAKMRRRIRQGLIWVLIVAAVLLLANLVWGGSEAEALSALL